MALQTTRGAALVTAASTWRRAQRRRRRPPRARVGAAARHIRPVARAPPLCARGPRPDDLPGARVDVSVRSPAARGVLALAQARGELVVRGIRLRQRGFLLRDRSLQLRLARVLRLSLLVVLRDLAERLQLRARVRERLPAPALRRDRRGSLQATRDVAQDHVQGLARGRLFVLPEDGQGVRGEPRVHEHGRGGGRGGVVPPGAAVRGEIGRDPRACLAPGRVMPARNVPHGHGVDLAGPGVRSAGMSRLTCFCSRRPRRFFRSALRLLDRVRRTHARDARPSSRPRLDSSPTHRASRTAPSFQATRRVADTMNPW